LQVKTQLMSPTSHCAILRASPMLQAPSRFTSHASGRGELATLPQLHIELGYDERISDIDDPVPVHVVAEDWGGRGDSVGV